VSGAPGGNPYLAAREEFISTFGDLARGKRNWQVCAFGLLGMQGLILAAYLRLSLSARITPYVVEVDRLGQAVAFGPAEPLRTADARIYVFFLGLFIHHLRTVSADADTERDLLQGAYAFAAGGARATLDSWFADPAHDPRVLGREVSRDVQITSVLRVPGAAGAAGKTWKVAWRETDRPRVAGAARTATWEAYLTVATHAPTTAEGLLRNPLGLYVTDLSWAEIAAGAGTEGR
jgi:type IV secretory pathway TrbF-like protein